jgi:transcriptional regulator with XRE-family HTH domain
MGRSSRPQPKRLGEKLRQIRAALNLTLEQIIDRLGYKDSPIYPTNISGMERGEREPPLLLLLAYARLAGVSTDILIDDKLELPYKIGSKSVAGLVKRASKVDVARTAKRQGKN